MSNASNRFSDETINAGETGPDRTAHRALDALAVQTAVLDEYGVIRYVNKAWVDFARQNGLKKDIPGEVFLETPEPGSPVQEKREKFISDMADVLSGKKQKALLEYSIPGQDAAKWLQLKGVRLPDPGPAGLVVSRTDVTEFRLMQDELQDKEERLRFLGENMPALLEAFDENGVLTAWNKEAERVTGRTAEEVIGSPRGMELLYPDPEIRNAIIQGIKSRGRDFQDREWPVTCRDGSKKIITWFNISSYFPIPGWFRWAIGFDITERIKAEIDRRETQKRFKLFLNNLPGPASIKNADGRYELVNAYFETFLNVDDYRTLMGKEDEDLFPPEFSRQYRANDKLVLAEGIPMEFVETTPSPNGLRHWLCVKFPLLQDDAPMLIGTIAVEITDRIRVERELEARRQELRLKAENLKEVNIALKVLLDQREDEKNRQVESITSTLEKLVSPHLKRLSSTRLDKEQTNLLSIIQSNLKEIASPFAGRLNSLEDKLSPAEFEAADLLRQGKTSEEIAEILHISVHTVSAHRRGIRRKLGLLNKRVNLKSYLRSLG